MPARLSGRAKDLKSSATVRLENLAKEMQRQGLDVLSFALGEPDFSTPPHICEAACKAIAEGKTTYTPAAGIPELREAIARTVERDYGYSCAPEQVVVSNGGKHALMNVWESILEPGDEVIIFAPYWVTYPAQIGLCGAKPRVVRTTIDNDFQPDLDEVRALVSERTAAILINSPSNPSGAVLERSIIEGLAEIAAEADCWIVSDEIYRHILFDGRQHFSPTMVGDEVRERVLLVDGASKAYSMTGWRIGWTVTPLEVAKAINRLQSQQASNPSSISQWAALAGLEGPQDCVRKMCAEFERRRDYIIPALADIPGVKIGKPAGAFYAFPEVSAHLDGHIVHKGKAVTNDDQLTTYLLEDALISTVPGSEFGLDGYIRLSFATSMDKIQEGVRRLRRGLVGG
ncbi:MAG: pyridoxal phosphate-dependent aminotransferase [Armatimonadota bacterium]